MDGGCGGWWRWMMIRKNLLKHFSWPLFTDDSGGMILPAMSLTISCVAHWRMIQTDQHSKRITWPFTSTGAAPSIEIGSLKISFSRKHEESHDRFIVAERSEHVKPWQPNISKKEKTTTAGCLWHLNWGDWVYPSIPIIVIYHNPHRPRYFRRQMNLKSYGVESAAELVDLVKDAAWNLRNFLRWLSLSPPTIFVSPWSGGFYRTRGWN